MAGSSAGMNKRIEMNRNLQLHARQKYKQKLQEVHQLELARNKSQFNRELFPNISEKQKQLIKK